MFAALVVDKITINADRDNALELVESISGCSSLKSSLCTIKALKLLTLSETVLPSDDGEWDNKYAQDLRTRRVECDAIFTNALPSALSRLEHVQKIKWVYQLVYFVLDVLMIISKVGNSFIRQPGIHLPSWWNHISVPDTWRSSCCSCWYSLPTCL